MGYALGIDLGTTFTAAALVRWGAPGTESPEPVALGSSTTAVPTVVHLADDGAVLVGEAAVRRGADSPDRVVAEFKRRVGDDVPLLVGDTTVAAHDLVALVVRWVVDVVEAREGGAPAAVVLTHPAVWGEHRTGLLRGALAEVGLDEVELLPEPVAAARHHATRARAAGSTVAVYDLGGGTFDAAVVRAGDDGRPQLLGPPGGLEDLGGADVDDAVLGHVLACLPPEAAGLDPADPQVATALLRLRRECVEAKEALSADTEATIPVLLPGVSTRVRLLRSELEEMVREPLERTVAQLRSTLAGSGVQAADLDRVLLVGGSSRIPLVAELISRELARPVAVDADPKLTTALGAAAAGAEWARGATGAVDAVAPAEGALTDGVPARTVRPSLHPATAWGAPARPAAVGVRTGVGTGALSHRRTRWAVATAAAGVLLVAVATRATSDASSGPTRATGATGSASATAQQTPSGSAASAPAPSSATAPAQVQALVAARVPAGGGGARSSRSDPTLVVLAAGTPTAGVGVLATPTAAPLPQTTTRSASSSAAASTAATPTRTATPARSTTETGSPSSAPATGATATSGTSGTSTATSTPGPTASATSSSSATSTTKATATGTKAATSSPTTDPTAKATATKGAAGSTTGTAQGSASTGATGSASA